MNSTRKGLSGWKIISVPLARQLTMKQRRGDYKERHSLRKQQLIASDGGVPSFYTLGNTVVFFFCCNASSNTFNRLFDKLFQVFIRILRITSWNRKFFISVIWFCKYVIWYDNYSIISILDYFFVIVPVELLLYAYQTFKWNLEWDKSNSIQLYDWLTQNHFYLKKFCELFK